MVRRKLLAREGTLTPQPWRATCFGGPWDGRELAFRKLRAVQGPGGQVICWVADGEERFPELPDGSYAMTELGSLRWVSKRPRPPRGP